MVATDLFLVRLVINDQTFKEPDILNNARD